MKSICDILQTASLIYIVAVKINNNKSTHVEQGSMNLKMG